MEKRKFLLPLPWSFVILSFVLFFFGTWGWGRLGILAAFVINSVGWFFLWKSWHPPFLSKIEKFRFWGLDPWGFVQSLRVDSQLDPDFEFYLLPGDERYFFVFGPRQRGLHIIASEGFIKSLSNEKRKQVGLIVKSSFQVQQQWFWSMTLTLSLWWESFMDALPLPLRWLFVPVLWIVELAKKKILKHYVAVLDKRLKTQNLWRDEISHLIWSEKLNDTANLMRSVSAQASSFRKSSLFSYLSLLPAEVPVQIRVRRILGYFPH